MHNGLPGGAGITNRIVLEPDVLQTLLDELRRFGVFKKGTATTVIVSWRECLDAGKRVVLVDALGREQRPNSYPRLSAQSARGKRV